MFVTKSVLTGCFCLLALPLAFPVKAQKPDSSSVNAPPIETPAAHVVITVASKLANPVLVKDDPLVRDNKHPVQVIGLRSLRDAPLTFSVLVDSSGSTRDTARTQIKAATELFKSVSGRGGAGYLVLFRDAVSTEDRILDAQTAERILNTPGDRAGSTAVFDAIVHAAEKQLGAANNSPSGRRAIFLFSDGADNASHNTLDRTLATLQREGIQLVPIWMHSDEFSKKERKRTVANLLALSEGTGGYIETSDRPDQIVAHLLGMLHSQYELSFLAETGKANELHSIEVKALSKDITILAPTKYPSP